MFDRLRMPSLDGAAEWLNAEPLGPAGLRGHVVLVNFWTLTCINWLRQEPYVRAWSRAYRDDGLVVVGVHTPEFSFEHDIDLVRRATKERAIDYPVAVDNHYAIWNAFSNHYWPALYFVDRDGHIRDEHFGEGRYGHLEHIIQRLLGVDRAFVPIEGQGVEAEADWHHLRTPETYLGYRRSDQFASPDVVQLDERRDYGLPDGLPFNHWALSGRWTIEQEKVLLGRAGGGIAVRFEARDAHLVLSREEREPIPFRVLIDGEPPRQAEHARQCGRHVVDAVLLLLIERVDQHPVAGGIDEGEPPGIEDQWAPVVQRGGSSSSGSVFVGESSSPDRYSTARSGSATNVM